MKRWAVIATVSIAAGMAAGFVEGSTTADSGGGAVTETGQSDELIQLNLPKDTEVAVLVEYVSKRLGVNILYSDAVGRKKVGILSPARIPKSSLMELLKGVLRMSGLTITEAEQDGWLKIVPDKDLAAITGQLQQDPALLADAAAMTPVTQVFELSHVKPEEVEKAIRPFLSKPGGSSLAIGARNLLAVTDYAANVRRAAGIMAMLDRPGPMATIEFAPVKHQDASDLAKQVSTLLKQKGAIDDSRGGREGETLALTADPRTNQIIIICAEGEQADALALIRQLDVALAVETLCYTLHYATPKRIDRLARELLEAGGRKGVYTSTTDDETGRLFVTAPAGVHEKIAALCREMDVPDTRPTHTYRLKYTDPQRIDRLVQSMVSGDGGRGAYRSVIDNEAGLLIVTAPEPIHELVRTFLDELDVAPDDEVSPIRVYRLMNTTAADVLATIQSLQEGGRIPAAAVGGGEVEAVSAREPFVGPNRPPPPPGAELPEPPAYTDPEQAGKVEPAEQRAGSGRLGAAPPDATVTIDANTNSLIVVASPAVQAVYEKLIRMLDRRRPQVMVEVVLVTIDTSEGKAVGVELFYGDTVGPRRALTFSAFGLSTVDLNTGLLLEPGVGFNGTVIDAGTFSAVVRALVTDGRTRVVAAPRILANDNGTATLSSVAESPFTSVNASTTVATTSFAGYASAGTTVTVTPHISEGDHLQLQYSVTLNSFTGEGSSDVPPPRQTNTVNSEITIPDGHAVIVGGLTRKDYAFTASRIPILGQIPIIEYLFSNRRETLSESTLFVFIRPVILRDDRFADLKHLSERALERAEMPPNYPTSEPMIMQ